VNIDSEEFHQSADKVRITSVRTTFKYIYKPNHSMNLNFLTKVIFEFKGKQVERSWRGFGNANIEMVDIRQAVIYLISGNPNLKVSTNGPRDRTIRWVSVKLYREIKKKVEAFKKTKKVRYRLSQIENEKLRDQAYEKLVVSMREVIKVHPKASKADILKAFAEAMKLEIVQDVMES
jgi:hypothetical protein